MLLEVQKRDPDLQLLDELMTATFSQRRKEIIGDEPLISVVMDRWPALFSERQVTSANSDIHRMMENKEILYIIMLLDSM